MTSKSPHKLIKEYERLVEELRLLVSALSFDNLTIQDISLNLVDCIVEPEFHFRLSGTLRFTHTAITELREIGNDFRQAESLDELCSPEQFGYIQAVIAAWLAKKGLGTELMVHTWNIRHFLKKDTSATIPAHLLMAHRVEKCIDEPNPWL